MTGALALVKTLNYWSIRYRFIYCSYPSCYFTVCSCRCWPDTNSMQVHKVHWSLFYMNCAVSSLYYFNASFAEQVRSYKHFYNSLPEQYHVLINGTSIWGRNCTTPLRFLASNDICFWFCRECFMFLCFFIKM